MSNKGQTTDDTNAHICSANQWTGFFMTGDLCHERVKLVIIKRQHNSSTINIHCCPMMMGGKSFLQVHYPNFTINVLIFSSVYNVNTFDQNEQTEDADA